MPHRLNRAGPPPRTRRLMLLAFAVPLLAILFVRSAVSRNDGGHEDNSVVYVVRQVGTRTEITYSLPYLDGSGAICTGVQHELQRYLFYYAANTAFQTAGVLLSLRRNRPRLN